MSIKDLIPALFLFIICATTSCKKDIQNKYTSNNEDEGPAISNHVYSENGVINFVASYSNIRNTKNLPIPDFTPNLAVTIPLGTLSDTLSIIQGCIDYAPILHDKLRILSLNVGGGTLYIDEGCYPVLSEVQVVFYDTYSNQISPLTIIGISRIQDGKVKYPMFYDSLQSSTPHKFLNFLCTPNDDAKEVYINGLELVGNNVPVQGSHPFIGDNDFSQPSIAISNVNQSGIYNTIVRNQYGDAVRIANWSPSIMDDFNIGNMSTIDNCYFINNWSDNGRIDCGNGIMMWHVYRPVIVNTVVSNNFTTTQKYGTIGIVFESGTKFGTINNCLIQGYRDGIKCEQDFGGHTIQSNVIGKNRIAGITFGYSSSTISQLTEAHFAENIIKNNIFSYGQVNEEFGSNHSTFIYTIDNGIALKGMSIIGNTFNYYEEGAENKVELLNPNSPYSIYIQTHGQQGLNIEDNIYD